MNKLIKPIALSVILAAGTALIQGCAAPKVAVQQKNPDVTGVYMAIVNSKNQQETIAKLVVDGKNPDLVVSVAAVASVPLTTIKAALPEFPEIQLVADVAAADTDPVAYSPSTASGSPRSAIDNSSKKLRSVRNVY